MTPRPLSGAADIELALRRVGELLEAANEPHALVIVGGAALGLLGVVSRETRDVDILAFARARGRGAWTPVPPPQPLPDAFAGAIRTVGRDLGLADDWLNTGPALQRKQGLPRGLSTRVQWRQYASLRVGVAGRQDLIWLKLYATAARGPPPEARGWTCPASSRSARTLAGGSTLCRWRGRSTASDADEATDRRADRDPRGRAGIQAVEVAGAEPRRRYPALDRRDRPEPAQVLIAIGAQWPSSSLMTRTGNGSVTLPAYRDRCGNGISMPAASKAFLISSWMLFFRLRKFSRTAHTEN